MALIGLVIVLWSTRNYGAGITPDSVRYISVARNIAAGNGALTYLSAPLVEQPPFYSSFLAVVSSISDKDPLELVPVINSVIFGLIIYLSGLLFFKYLVPQVAYALLGTTVILVSYPLFSVSIMAWSEPIFIMFLLLSFYLMDVYINKGDSRYLVLVSISAGIACLTRYLGVTLIIWGVLVISLYVEKPIRNKLSHLVFFIILSITPITIWAIRSYILSTTFFGPRSDSIFSFSENLSSTFSTLILWFSPYLVIILGALLIVRAYLLFKFHGNLRKNSWEKTSNPFRKIGPLLIFIIIYTAFLLWSATRVAYDQINFRLLSPLFIPLTLMLLVLSKSIFESMQVYISSNIMKYIVISGLVVWIGFLLVVEISAATSIGANGEGYSNNFWRESETIHFVKNQPLQHDCYEIESNAPDVLYFLANIKSEMSPLNTAYNSTEVLNSLDGLREIWPRSDNTCLIWFDEIDRKYLFTVDELQSIAIIADIKQFDDGAIYSITKH